MSLTESLMRRSIALLAVLLLSAAALPAQAPPGSDPTLAARIKERYVKREMRIRVRDGAQLFTASYVPRDTTGRYPVLMSRTPYSVSP